MKLYFVVLLSLFYLSNADKFGYKMDFFSNTTYYPPEGKVANPISQINEENGISVLVHAVNVGVYVKYKNFVTIIYPKKQISFNAQQCQPMDKDNSEITSKVRLFYSDYKRLVVGNEGRKATSSRMYAFVDSNEEGETVSNTVWKYDFNGEMVLQNAFNSESAYKRSNNVERQIYRVEKKFKFTKIEGVELENLENEFEANKAKC